MRGAIVHSTSKIWKIKVKEGLLKDFELKEKDSSVFQEGSIYTIKRCLDVIANKYLSQMHLKILIYLFQF
ncbi:MAG: hypothetical protein QXO82_06305 [Candidatus Methanomethylicia archaeon]